MSWQDFDEAVNQYNVAMRKFFEGDPEPLNKLYSDIDTISLAQLSGSFIIGRKQVTDTAIHNAAKYREGVTTFETLAKYAASEVGYVVQVERTKAKIDGGNEFVSLALRVTSIFRFEGEVWRLLHRHVDSNVVPQG